MMSLDYVVYYSIFDWYHYGFVNSQSHAVWDVSLNLYLQVLMSYIWSRHIYSCQMLAATLIYPPHDVAEEWVQEHSSLQRSHYTLCWKPVGLWDMFIEHIGNNSLPVLCSLDACLFGCISVWKPSYCLFIWGILQLPNIIIFWVPGWFLRNFIEKTPHSKLKWMCKTI